MKLRTALELLQGLMELDGYLDGADKRVPYKFNGATRMAIARMRRQLRALQEDYSEARNAALVEITNGSGELKSLNGPFESREERDHTRAAIFEFARRDRELLNAPVDLDLASITVAQLALDDNPIPPSVLDVLGPILQEE